MRFWPKKNIIKDFTIPPPEVASSETWSTDMYPLHLYKHSNYLQLNVKKKPNKNKGDVFHLHKGLNCQWQSVSLLITN